MEDCILPSMYYQPLIDLLVESVISPAEVSITTLLTINSSDKNVRVAEFKEFCCETYLLVNEISWIQVSPSAHIVLAHSAEFIEQNDSKGLLNFTECGIEANNKFLRQYRMNYASKTSQFDNLSDCINRLWD